LFVETKNNSNPNLNELTDSGIPREQLITIWEKKGEEIII